MANLGALAVYLTAETGGFKRGLKSASMATVAFKAAAVAALAVTARSVSQFVSQSVEAYKIQEKAERKLQGTLAATQNAVGFTHRELTRYASQMQSDMGVADEKILEHMGVLTTFKQVQGSVFKGAIGLVEDMAIVMGTEARSAAIQLGKALNDPIKGLNGLSRAGVQFNKTQREQITKMVETNNLIGAQTAILRELETQFGGVAKAIRNTDVGRLEQASMAFGDMSEKVGKLALKIVPLTLIKNVFEGAGIAVADIARGLDLATKSSEELVSEIGQVAKEAGHIAEEAQKIQEIAWGKRAIDKQVSSAIELTQQISKVREQNALIGATDEQILKHLKDQVNLLNFRISAYQRQERSQDQTNKMLQLQVDREKLLGRIKQTQLDIDRAAALEQAKLAKETEKAEIKADKIATRKIESMVPLAAAMLEGSSAAYSVTAQARADRREELEQASAEALQEIEAAVQTITTTMQEILGLGTYGISGG